MSCLDKYASPEDYVEFWCLDSVCDGEVEAIIDRVLTIAASDVNSAIAGSNACDCDFADWANEYLKKLNIIDAAIYHHCPCARPKLDSDTRQMYLEWIDNQLQLIRTGKLELCDGETGADFPAVDYAELTWTTFNTARIIANTIKRSR